jgi:hypothetical protein
LEREIMVSRIRRFSPWLVALVMAVPLAPACAQNLDAGKSAAQIFSEACSGCHRSPRELKGNPGASFLREHYTTGSEMASTMAAYLAGGGAGGSEGRPGAAQPKRPPNPPTGSPTAGTTPAAATGRDAPAPEPANSRRAQQTPDPKAPPGSPKGHPARAEGTAEAKPLASAPPAPARPALEEFEE